MVTGAPKDLCRLALAGGALLALACGHTDPFSTPPYGTTQPFDPTPPVRLTLNDGPDRDASWLPDGSGILYSAQQLGRPDFDVCLAELPPEGGTQRRLVCDLSLPDANLTNTFQSPVAAADGRLAFVKTSGSVNGFNPSAEALAIAPGLDGANATNVVRIPYTLPSEPTHAGIAQVRWLREDALIYLAEAVEARYPCPPPQCTLDTMATGLAVAVLNLSPGGGSPAVVPGTTFASGVAAGSTGDEIYFTLNGDTRVYRRVLSTGDQTVVHDFGAAGVVRDVHLAGGRLTAIVGGRVHVVPDATFGQIQRDSGGVVHMLDLASDTDVALADAPHLFRRPVLAPTGDRLVVEGYPFIISNGDTTVSRKSDLYLFSVP